MKNEKIVLVLIGTIIGSIATYAILHFSGYLSTYSLRNFYSVPQIEYYNPYSYGTPHGNFDLYGYGTPHGN